MSRLSTMHDAIVAAINGCPALATVPVQDAVDVQAIWGNAIKKPGIVLIYVGTQKKGQGTISGYTNDPCQFVWQIAFVTQDWQTSIGALSKAGGIWDMADAIMGPAQGEAGIRPVKLMNLGPDLQSISLIFVSEQMITPPDRPDRGGPAALVITMATFPDVYI